MIHVYSSDAHFCLRNTPGWDSASDPHVYFHSGPTTYQLRGCLLHTGNNPHHFGSYKEQCQKIDKTRHSVSITLLSYSGPIWMCWLHNPISCLLPPTVEAGSTVAANLAFVIFEEKLCLLGFMHLLKSLVKYKFINDAMRKFSPSLTEFYKF